MDIVDYDLTCALPDLSLAIEFVASSKSVNLIIVSAWGVSAPALDNVICSVVNIVPLG